MTYFASLSRNFNFVPFVFEVFAPIRVSEAGMLISYLRLYFYLISLLSAMRPLLLYYPNFSLSLFIHLFQGFHCQKTWLPKIKCHIIQLMKQICIGLYDSLH